MLGHAEAKMAPLVLSNEQSYDPKNTDFWR